MAKYTHDQRVQILQVCLSCAMEELNVSAAKSQVRSISKDYPLNTLMQEISRLKKYMAGEATYGYGYAATWAKALLEVTQSNKQVVAALKKQQATYLEKEGKVNKKLAGLISGI